jgi:hypothetical protein
MLKKKELFMERNKDEAKARIEKQNFSSFGIFRFI